MEDIKEFYNNNMYTYSNDKEVVDKIKLYWLDYYKRYLKRTDILKISYKEMIKRANDLVTMYLGAWNTSDSCEFNALVELIKEKYPKDYKEIIFKN